MAVIIHKVKLCPNYICPNHRCECVETVLGHIPTRIRVGLSKVTAGHLLLVHAAIVPNHK